MNGAVACSSDEGDPSEAVQPQTTIGGPSMPAATMVAMPSAGGEMPAATPQDTPSNGQAMPMPAPVDTSTGPAPDQQDNPPVQPVMPIPDMTSPVVPINMDPMAMPSGSGGAEGDDSTAMDGAGGTSPEGAGGEPSVPDTPPPPMGGPSAAAVCEPGASYGNPLDSMGAVVEYTAPTMGDATYFAFIEGPIWVHSVGTLFFSDNASSPEERIWMLVPPSTTPEVFMENSGSNGLALNGNDELVLADQRRNQIVTVDPNTAMVTGTPVPSTMSRPNDLVVRSDGNIYYTDPSSGFFRVSPSGEVTGPLTAPGANGILLHLDETMLYVGSVQNQTITTFSLDADGSVDEGSASLWATTKGQTLDGMGLDCAGNLYAATATAVEVFSANADPLGSVPTGESSNVTFGGPERRTLYVTSRAVLKAVELAVPGLPY